MKCSSAISVQNNYSSPTVPLGCQPPAPPLVLWGEYPVLAASGLALKALAEFNHSQLMSMYDELFN